MNILGVILAGGLARRMGGGDKALIVLGGRTLLDRAVERLSPQVDAVVINANDDPARFGSALPVIPDLDDSRAGPPFDPFFNVNTPEDLTEAEGLLA